MTEEGSSFIEGIHAAHKLQSSLVLNEHAYSSVHMQLIGQEFLYLEACVIMQLRATQHTHTGAASF